MKSKQSGVTKLITLARTQTALAEQLNVTQSAVQKWVRQGYAPQKRIRQIIELYPQLTEEDLINPAILDKRYYSLKSSC